MGVEAIGERTDESFGQSKANSRPLGDRTRQLVATEWNLVAEALIEVQEAIGTTTDPAASSIEKRLRCHTVTVLAAFEGPFDGAKASTECYATRGDEGGGEWVWSAGSSTTANGGTVVGALAAGRWKRVYSGPVHAAWFGAVGDGTIDDSASLLAATTAAPHVRLAKGKTYRVGDQIAISSTCVIEGPGTIQFDRTALGICTHTFLVTANDCVFRDVVFEPRTNPGTGGLVVDTTTPPSSPELLPYCIKFVTDTGRVEGCTFKQGVPNGVYSGKASNSVTIRNCRFFGMLSGLAQDSSDHMAIFIEDGENCHIVDNYFEGFAQGVLFGLSTNHSVIRGNVAKNCGNHLAYVSSGDWVTVEGNIAYGTYTDIKVRGDYNQVIGNKVYGGALSMTNRNLTTGVALNSAVCTGNMIACSRAGDYALSIINRTSFDGSARNVVCSGNSVDCLAAVTYAIFIQFATMKNVACNGNVVSGTAPVADAIRVTSTANALTDIYNVSICNNTVEGAGESAIQVTGTRVTIMGNACVCDGGTGSNAGGILAICDNSTIVGNSVEVTHASTVAIQQKTGDYCVITSNRMKVNGANYISKSTNSTDANNIKA